MPTYVLLTTFTQEGVVNVRDSPGRTEHAKEMVESLGGIWQDFFVTMGRYDGVVIVDFPDDATAAQAVLTRGKRQRNDRNTPSVLPRRVP